MGKGKVHPSPASGGGGHTAEEVLRLLPAAVMAMAVALGDEGKEVLAYLVLSSTRSPAADQEPRGKSAPTSAAAAAHHRPELGCGCFECYTFYWSRWDSSPEREAIHRAIEAFEEHLAEREKGRRRRRKPKEKDKAAVEAPAPAPAPEAAPEAATAAAEEEAEVTVAADGEVAAPEEKKKAGDVAGGVFNWRLWSLWGSGGLLHCYPLGHGRWRNQNLL